MGWSLMESAYEYPDDDTPDDPAEAEALMGYPSTIPSRLDRPVADDDPFGVLLWHIDKAIATWEEDGLIEDFDPVRYLRTLRAIADEAMERRARKIKSRQAEL